MTSFELHDEVSGRRSTVVAVSMEDAVCKVALSLWGRMPLAGWSRTLALLQSLGYTLREAAEERVLIIGEHETV